MCVTSRRYHARSRNDREPADTRNPPYGGLRRDEHTTAQVAFCLHYTGSPIKWNPARCPIVRRVHTNSCAGYAQSQKRLADILRFVQRVGSAEGLLSASE